MQGYGSRTRRPFRKPTGRRVARQAGNVSIQEDEIALRLWDVGLHAQSGLLDLLPTTEELARTHTFILDLSRLKTVYPSFVATLGCWLRKHWLDLDGARLQIVPPIHESANSWLRSIGFYSVIEAESRIDTNNSLSVVLSSIQPGDSQAPEKMAADLVALALRSGLQFSSDASNSTYTALAEVSENVVRHANMTTPAFACAQVHPKRHKIAIAIADSGIGIEASFRAGPYAPARERLAAGEHPLRLATEPLMSSKYGMGHSGYGLFFASELCRLADGTFQVTSGRSTLVAHHQETIIENHAAWDGTIVELLLNARSKIDGADIWHRLFTPETMEECSRFVDVCPAEIPVLRLTQDSRRLFTRDAARKALTLAVAVLHGRASICIDLTGCIVITPSYADEFFCGLVRRVGIDTYRGNVLVRGADQYARNLIEMVILNAGLRPAGM